MPQHHLHWPAFQARVISGAGRGRRIGTPTLNVDLRDVPPALQEGIYACRARTPPDISFLDAVMHYGPRPVFKDSVTCEVHLLDQIVRDTYATIDVQVVGFLRAVANFPSVEDLQRQIAMDIVGARQILHAP